jgi:hypothetical protein
MTKTRTMVRRAGAAAILLMAFSAPSAWALEPTVPVDIQAGIIAKLWQLDRNFPKHVPMTLGVLYQEKFRTSFIVAHDLCDAFARAKLPVRCILIDISAQPTLADQLTRLGVDAIYIAPLRAIDVGMLVLVSRARRIRTVTAVDEYVMEGAAVGLALQGDHAQIVINLPAARAEGADFSSQLLKLARVIQ